MTLEIKTAAELIAEDGAGRQVGRRAARQTVLMRHVYRTLLARGEPVPVQELAASFPGDRTEPALEALARLDADDLLRITAGRVDLAYPFAAFPTPFAADLGPDAGERHVCCAVDALGLAPMLGRPVRVRSACHHCGDALTLTVTPSGPGPDASELMVWVGRHAEDDRRACDTL